MLGPAVDCKTDPIPAVVAGAPIPVVPACVNPVCSKPDGPATLNAGIPTGLDANCAA